MRPRAVAVDRVVLDGVPMPPGGAEGVRAALESRLAADLRDVPDAVARDPQALSREIGARVERFLREVG